MVRTSLWKRLLSFIPQALFVPLLGLQAALGLIQWESGYVPMWLLLIPPVALVALILLSIGPQPLQPRRGVVLTLGPDGMWISAGRSHGPLVWLPWDTVGRVLLRCQITDCALRVQTRGQRTIRAIPLANVNRNVKEIRAALARYAPAHATTDIGR